MKRKREIFKRRLFILSGLALATLIVGSCGGGGGGTSSSSGNVSLYVTDAPMDNFKQVKTTVNKIQLIHTGTSTSCDVLTTPTVFDITDLAEVMQLLNNASCPAENYNRIRIEFNRSLTITDAVNTTNTCSFTKYKDDDKFKTTPNVLQCDPNTSTCFIEINGAVNILANHNNNVALDFNLKEFEVEHLGLPDCSVTMKVSPLNAGEMEDKKGHDFSKEAVTGIISDLNTSSDTFTLKKGNRTFNVDYSIATGILTGKQQLPPVDSSGTGTATWTINPSTKEISGSLAFSSLTSNATASHIHLGAVGVNGPVQVALTDGSGATSGTFTIPATTLTPSQFDALKKELLYLNIHSVNHPDGEIRGQIIYPSQTKIDDLLQFAVNNNLRIKVLCSNSVSDTNSCFATSLFVKIEGKVSNLDETNHSFTLVSKGGLTIKVDYTQAYDDNGVEGVIADNKRVEVKLFNMDDKGSFIALQVKRKHADENEDEHEDEHENED